MHCHWYCDRCEAHGELEEIEPKHLAMAWPQICAEHRRQSPHCTRTDTIRVRMEDRERQEKGAA